MVTCSNCGGMVTSVNDTIIDLVGSFPLLLIIVSSLSLPTWGEYYPLWIPIVGEPPKSEESDTAERSAYFIYNMVDLNKKCVCWEFIRCSGKLDCKELQSALSVGGLQFSLPTVNILLAKHDRNRKYVWSPYLTLVVS